MGKTRRRRWIGRRGGQGRRRKRWRRRGGRRRAGVEAGSGSWVT